MSLRVKLIWAFVMVALVALIPAAIIFNVGFYRFTMAPGPGMGPPPGAGQGQRQGPMGRSGEGVIQADPATTPRYYFDTARVWSLWSAAGALVIAGAAALWTSGRITRSLRYLRDAAGNLDLRDLSRRVPVEGDDEITDLAQAFNRMCDRLQAEERARRQLLADVAHELRHPLAVMQGQIDLIQDGKVELDTETLLPLEDEVIRLTRLVGDLRDLSLAEVGRLSLHLSAVDLSELMAGLMTNLQPVAEGKLVSLSMQAEQALPPIMADPDRLRQVLINLVANALHYAPEGGVVSLTAMPQGEQVVIRCRDSGPGIAAADLPHIFDRFYRADRSRARSSGGSGLGLAIVRSLTELHGGRVTAESSPGKGALFTVTLPVQGPGAVA